jgi:hypothetical protein
MKSRKSLRKIKRQARQKVKLTQQKRKKRSNHV